MTRRLHVGPAICVLAFLAWLLLPAPAHGGAYFVRSCHADGMNAIFNASYTAGATAYVQCPGGVNGRLGLVARSNVDPKPAAGFSHARLYVNAPAGTYFDQIRFAAQIIQNRNWRAGIYDRQHGAWLWCGDSCSSFPIWGSFSRVGFATNALELLTICAASECSREFQAHGLIALKDVTLRVQDTRNPSVAIVGGSLATSGWKRGMQTVEIAGSDNTGIRSVNAFVDGKLAAAQLIPCDDHRLVPCPATARRVLAVDMSRLVDGKHSLEVQAVDSGGNVSKVQRVVLSDNTAPDPPVQLSTATPRWEPENSFSATWSNPGENGGAPVAAVVYELCPEPSSPATACSVPRRAVKAQIASLDKLALPAPGEWRLRVWLVDAAGNQNEQTSREVLLRWDPDDPAIALLPRREDDPARIRVLATDAVSGIASAEIEVRRENTSTWHSLPVEATSSGFTAVIDDEAFPPGTYAVRARASDHAGNERSVDGTSVQLPLRVPTRLAVGLVDLRKPGRSGARPRRVLIRRPTTSFGKSTTLSGRLVSPGGNPLAARDVEVAEQLRQPGEEWRPVATVRTNTSGRFKFQALPGASRLLRFRFPGTATIRGETSVVDLRVRASGTLKVSRRSVVNGQGVTFRGTVNGQPLPPTGKLLQLQVLSRGRWLTFATPRADGRGRWEHPYRFTATRGVTRYRFRVRIPREAGFPFHAGTSTPVRVKVTGL